MTLRGDLARIIGADAARHVVDSIGEYDGGVEFLRPIFEEAGIGNRCEPRSAFKKYPDLVSATA
jgi:hypothetical protein